MTAPPSPSRIAIVLHSRERGGLEGLAIRLAADWQAAGAEVTLITIAKARSPLALPDGVRDICLDHPITAGKAMTRLIALVLTTHRMRQIFREYAPDVVVSHGDRTNALALLAHRKLSGRRIVVEHNDVRFHAIGRFWEAFRALAYPNAHRVIGVSRGVIAGMPEPWQLKARAIPNPIPTLQRPQGLTPDPHCIVALGRLAPQKGFDLLITAFAMLVPRYPTLNLIIHGEGPERAALEAQIASFGLGERISLPGRTDDPARALAAGGIFAFPSRYEGFGLALGEAMSLGLPVVAADCPSGPGEMIRDGENGLLVPPDDAEALAAGLALLIDDPAYATRLGEAARAISVEFSDARWLEEWREEVGLNV